MINTPLVVFAVGAAAAAVLTPVVSALARRIGFVDQPDARKVHSTVVPRIGGVAIALATACGAAVCLAMPRSSILIGLSAHRIIVLCASVAFVFLLGLLDDIINLPSKLKLVGLLAATIALCSVGIRIDSVHVGGRSLFLGPLAWPVTIFWIVGVTVAMNFIDGLDGLAAGIGAIASGVLALSAAWSGQGATALLSLALLGALSGFLPYNFNPAKTFMGDCGSMFLGFTLATLGIMEESNDQTSGALLPGIALAVPLIDTAFTMIRRGVLWRRSIFAAERGHVHHRLLDLGYSQRKAVLTLYAVSIASGGAGLCLLSGSRWAAVALGAALLFVLAFFHQVGAARIRETVGAVRRNRTLSREIGRCHRVFDRMQIQFARAETFDEWWQLACDAAEQLGFGSLQLTVVNRNGKGRALKWGDFVEDDSPTSMTTTLPLRDRRGGGTLPLRLKLAAPTCLETAGHRMALFSRLMNEHSIADLRRADSFPDPRFNKDIFAAANPGHGRQNGNGSSLFRGKRAESIDSEATAHVEPRGLKILLHDYGGHAFIAQLGRELSRRGHRVTFAYSGSVQTPHGDLERRPGDPDTIRFEPIVLAEPISRHSFLKRRYQESEHGERLIELVNRQAPDVLICATTPSEIQDRAINHCRSRGIRTIAWVQDLHGVAAYTILRRKLPIIGTAVGRYYMWLDRRSLCRSDAVVLITDSFRQQMLDWGVPDDRLTCIPNWGPLSDLPRQPKDNQWSREHGLHDKICLLYCGTLGMKHNPTLLLGLAERFRARPDIRVVVVSKGTSVEWLAGEAERRGLKNLVTLPFQPFSLFPQMLASGDVLVSILEPEASAFSVPSKVLAYLCAGRAILLAVPKENLAAQMVISAGAGRIVAPSDPEGFAAAAASLVNDPALRIDLGDRGRSYAESQFDILKIAHKFECLIVPERALKPAAITPQHLRARPAAEIDSGALGLEVPS
jgi:UDP-N-acetylmuramyl pentapeptide phosphotransferase/UDP-N-acetylglucosamine-1-phosphate transferase/glycosyltransferase involved in cell wall biosynthesis